MRYLPKNRVKTDNYAKKTHLKLKPNDIKD